MSNQTIKSEYRGELEIGDIIIPCAVLNDGTRVVGENGINKHLGVSGGKSYKLRDNIEKLRGRPTPIFLASKALEPFMDDVFDDSDLEPVEYEHGGNKMVGYRAEILPKVCEVWLKARQEGTLQGSQLPKAMKAEILMRGLAHIGITALVDEATGYQYDRERFELQKILKLYISEEVLKWQLTFTNDFYKQVFRLWGVPFTAKSIQKKPQFIGKLTNKYIYENLPDGVLSVLKDKTPKTEAGNYKHKFHQILTPEAGREHLKKQITEVTTLMEISDSKEQFQFLYKKKYNTDPQYELQIDFNNDSKPKKNPQSNSSKQASLDF